MDLFGDAISDWINGQTEKLVLERDDGYFDEQSVSSYFARFDSFPGCERKALGLAKGRVLDIGVGPGRVSLHLQDTGLEAVGVDVSERMLEAARRRGVRNAVKMSACDLRFPKDHFQTAIAFGNNFGLCGTPEGVMSMLVRLREIVSDDGVFLAESIDPLKTTKPEHLNYHERNRSMGRMPGQVRLRFHYKGMVDDWFGLLMVTPDEMRGLAERTGWTVTDIFSASDLGFLYVAALRKKA
jgi:SAM-dependent methyltransferase